MTAEIEPCPCVASDHCDYCGCCQHSTGWCRVCDAPRGMSCPNGDCGCEGLA